MSESTGYGQVSQDHIGSAEIWKTFSDSLFPGMESASWAEAGQPWYARYAQRHQGA